MKPCKSKSVAHFSVQSEKLSLPNFTGALKAVTTQSTIPFIQTSSDDALNTTLAVSSGADQKTKLH